MGDIGAPSCHYHNRAGENGGRGAAKSSRLGGERGGGTNSKNIIKRLVENFCEEKYMSYHVTRICVFVFVEMCVLRSISFPSGPPACEPPNSFLTHVLLHFYALLGHLVG